MGFLQKDKCGITNIGINIKYNIQKDLKIDERLCKILNYNKYIEQTFFKQFSKN